MRLVLLGAIGALLLTGCLGPDEQLDNQTETDTMEQQQADQAGAEASGAEGSELSGEPIAGGADVQTGTLEDDLLTPSEMLADPTSPLATRIIYFEYDSAKVTDDSLGALEAHGNFVASNGNVSVRLEGHADERGSREYNIGLGDRRAQSVRRILLFQGASSGQVETVSYGEEKPSVIGHSEDAWAKNRRVELVYQVR
jgi:peptidoglycan-associated lipoprotein